MADAVIFDLDGTLIDSAPSIARAVNAMLAELGAAPLTLPVVMSFIGNGLPVLVRRVMAARSLPPAQEAEVQALTMHHYQAASTDSAHFYPGAEAMLHSLAATGHPLGICTNKPEALAQAILAQSGTLALFAALTGGDTFPTCKPDPAPLLATLAALGGGPAIFVGDSEIDAETAERAALPFALFTGGYAKRPHAEIPATARFDHHDDLPGLIASLRQT